MAWTAPRTWATGELVTASMLNAHLRDNLLETAPAKVTTAGDTVYATGANALSRLALGAAGTIFVGGASAPSWTGTPTISGRTIFQDGVSITSGGGAVADSGLIRMKNDSGIFARNAGATANINLAYLNSGDAAIYGGTGAVDIYIDNGTARETFFRFNGTASFIVNNAGVIWNSVLGDALGVKLTKTATRTVVFDSGETGGTAVVVNVGVSGTSNAFTVYGNITAAANVSCVILSAPAASSLSFALDSAVKWVINTSGHFVANADNTYDIGQSGATRPRNLYVAGTIVAPAITVPWCQVYNSGTLALTTGTGTTVLFDTEVSDTGAMHSTVSNQGRITCVQAGLYVVTASIQFAASAVGDRLVEIRKTWSGGGSNAIITSSLCPPNAAVETTVTVTALVSLAAGDYVECRARQTSGGNLNISAATSTQYDYQGFSALWVGTI